VTRTVGIFDTYQAQNRGIIRIARHRFDHELCWQTFLGELRRRQGFTLKFYGTYYLVFCNPVVEMAVNPFGPFKLAA